MNTNHADAMSMNTDNAANDLTQLSSREQLSALMDGALPPDQTRFLLRRLQHDASLAECWGRWRMAGETMRGLAPAQRLPADFASRVSAALHGPAETAQARDVRRPAWRRWGGGVAMAASLAVVALIARQPDIGTGAATDAIQLASASAPATTVPKANVTAGDAPATPAPITDDAAQPLLAATAAAATVRPRRERATERAGGARAIAAPREVAVATQVATADLPVPQPDIVTRPWPRSVLPQYASGGLAVGFGEHGQGAAYNPFAAQAGIGNLPPPAEPAGSPGESPAAAMKAAQDEPRR